MLSDHKKRREEAIEHVRMMDKNIDDAQIRRVKCDLGCMNSRDRSPCKDYSKRLKDYSICMKGCIDEYNRDRKKFIKIRNYWSDILDRLNNPYGFPYQ